MAVKKAEATKDNRIDFRIDDYCKRTIEQAAALNHLSLSSYILSVSMRQAEIDLKKHEELVLSNNDRDFIMGLLEESTQPNEALVRLMQ